MRRCKHTGLDGRANCTDCRWIAEIADSLAEACIHGKQLAFEIRTALDNEVANRPDDDDLRWVVVAIEDALRAWKGFDPA